MKKGFTLIELLAVIIILAIIALIATPIILDVIEETKESAAKSEASMIVSGINNYCAAASMKEQLTNEANICKDGITDAEVATMVDLGNAKVKDIKYENGRITKLEVVSNGKVVIYDGSDFTVTGDAEADEPEDIEDTELPTVEFTIPEIDGLNGWYKTEPYIVIKVNDTISGVLNYKWCIGLDCTPSQIETANKTVQVLDTLESQVCVIAKDKALNTTDKICSDIIKVDTVKPSFSGIGDIVVSKDATVDLTNNVEVTDTTSGIEGTYSYDPTSVDTSKTGTIEVEYSVSDKAGNTSTITRKVIVSASAPSVTFTAESGYINEFGWAKSDFYVTINAIDNSGHGIKEMNICTATTDTCDPSTGSNVISSEATRLISVESNNNRICVQAIDNTDNATETICSDAYKLDKTLPIVGTMNVTGTKGLEDWYTSNVTISAADGSDSLSGHLSTVVDTTSITSNTTGTKVTITTTDKAGNVSTKEETIKIDKEQPIVTFEIEDVDGLNGWYKTEQYVTGKVSSAASEFKSLKWCVGLNCEPSNEITENSKTVKIIDTTGTQLCIEGYSISGNSKKECTSTIKVDTVKPSFSGIGDIVVSKDTTVDLTNNVEVADSTSGIDGTYSYTPTSVDTSKAGVTNVTYTAVDNAGNETTITRKVTVSTTAPNITFTPEEGYINGNGWAKNDFYVTIKATDNSGHGIKEMYICTATTDTCEPTIGSKVTSNEAKRLISTESNNNRICVQAIDNYNQATETICSDAYKLDKTLPTITYSVLGGTYNETKTIRVTPSDSNHAYLWVDVYKNNQYVESKSISTAMVSSHELVLDSEGEWKVFSKAYDWASNKQEQEPNNGESGFYYQTYIIDTTAPKLTLSKTTYYEDDLSTWTLNNAKINSDGSILFPNTNSNITKLFPVNGQYWKFDVEYKPTKVSDNCASSNEGGIYSGDAYYDSSFNRTVSQNGYDGNGFADCGPLSNWNTTSWDGWAGYGNNVKYVSIGIGGVSYYAQVPFEVRNFKLYGQLYSDFYIINYQSTDSDVKVVKYAKGNQTAAYFKTNGIVVTDQIKVYENGTYTVYVEDNAGNYDIKTIVIDKIDKGVPTISAKQEQIRIKKGTNINIWDYLNYSNNGITDIITKKCVNNDTYETITDTSNLEPGSYNLTCQVIQGNNKYAEASIKLSILDYGTSISTSYENLYWGSTTGTLVPKTITVSTSHKYSVENYNYLVNVVSGLGNGKLLSYRRQHNGPAGTTYEQITYGQDYINAGDNYYPLETHSSLNKWINLYLMFGYANMDVKIGNLKIRFEDGKEYSLKDAVANGYIEPLVLISSRSDSTNYLMYGALNLLDGGYTENNNYPKVDIIFKVSGKSRMTGISLYSNKDISRKYNDGLFITEYDDIDFSLKPW